MYLKCDPKWRRVESENVDIVEYGTKRRVDSVFSNINAMGASGQCPNQVRLMKIMDIE